MEMKQRVSQPTADRPRRTAERNVERPGARPGPQPFPALPPDVGNHSLHELVSGGATLGPEQPLDARARDDLEARFGADFRDVRLHTGSEAARQAEALGAKAFTLGRHIAFGTGRYAPSSGEGRRLLAHELAHVIQQRRGGPPPALDESAPHERGADAAAQAFLSGSGPVSVAGATSPGIARQTDDDKRRRGDTLRPDSKIKDPGELRKKHILQEYAERAHDPKQSAELAEEKTTKRTGRSEQSRHATRTQDIHEHHGYPKFLGGERIQTYIKLPQELHYLYHEELYHLLEKEYKRLGKLPPDAGRSSRRHYGRIFDSLTPEQKQDILDKTIAHAEDFDNRYRKADPKRNLAGYPDKRQRLAAALRRGIKEARAAAKAQAQKAAAAAPKGAAAKGSGAKASTPAGTAKPKTKATVPLPKGAATPKVAPTTPEAAEPQAAPTPEQGPHPAVKTPPGAAAPPRTAVPPPKAATKPTAAPKTPAAPPKVTAPRGTMLSRPAIRARIASGLQGAAGIAFAVGLGLLTSYVKGKLDQQVFEQQMRDLAPDIQADIEAKGEDYLSLAVNNPGKPLYVNITITTYVTTAYVEMNTAESTPTVKYQRGAVAISLQDINTTKHDYDAGYGTTTSIDTITYSAPIEPPKLEDLIDYAKAAGLNTTPLRVYLNQQIDEATSASDSGLGPRKYARFSALLQRLDE